MAIAQLEDARSLIAAPHEQQTLRRALNVRAHNAVDASGFSFNSDDIEDLTQKILLARKVLGMSGYTGKNNVATLTIERPPETTGHA